MIKPSPRLDKVTRVFDPYFDRRDFVRLDRNEDPSGYDKVFFNNWLQSITTYNIAAYSDSTCLINKLASWLKVNTNNLYIGAGSDAIIKSIFETYIDKGQTIILQDPCWRMYNVYAQVYGADVISCPYDNEMNFDFAALLEKIKKNDVRMIVLANPNQPTGTLFLKHDLIKLLELAKNNNILVIIDEAYHLFCTETVADKIGIYDNLIVVRTFSKAFGLAGLRVGYAIADNKRIQDLMLLRPVTDANSLAINFAEYLIDNIEAVLQKIQSTIEGREFIYEACIQSGLTCYKSHANFFLIRYPSFEQAQDIIQKIKEKKYTLKGPFSNYPIENCIRISIGNIQLMRQFWRDCKDILTL